MTTIVGIAIMVVAVLLCVPDIWERLKKVDSRAEQERKAQDRSAFIAAVLLDESKK